MMKFEEVVRKMKEGKKAKSIKSGRIISVRDTGGSNYAFYEFERDDSGMHSTAISYYEAINEWEMVEEKTLSDKFADINEASKGTTKPYMMLHIEDVKKSIKDIKEDIEKAGEQLRELDIHALDDKEVIEIINKRVGKWLI